MDEAKHNSEIEKIANLMVHDNISLDEEDVTKLEKYKNIIKEDCSGIRICSHRPTNRERSKSYP